MQEIKEEINSIHEIMDNSEMTDNVKVIQLQEGMADERDSLYEMEQILKLPFELRECKCSALDDETK